MDEFTLWIGVAVILGGLVGWCGGAIHGFKQGIVFGVRSFEARLDTVDKFMGGELRDVLERADKKAKTLNQQTMKP